MPYGPATIPHLPPVWTGLYPYPKRSRTHWLIRHGAGTLDISVRYARGLRWLFPDGTTSTAARPSKVVGAGTTLVTCEDFAERGVEVEVHNNVATLTPVEFPDLRWSLYLNASSVVVGAIRDLPRVEYYLDTRAAGLTGGTADLPRVRHSLFAQNCTLTGDVQDLPRVISQLYLAGFTGITGDAANLPRVSVYLSMNGLSALTGAFSSLPRSLQQMYLSAMPSGLSGLTSDLPSVSLNMILNTLAGLTGPTSGIPRVSSYMYLNALNGMTGDVADLPANTGERRCTDCALVTGDLPVVASNTPIYFRTNAAVSPAEYDQTIANCVAAGGTNRTLYISSRRTAASDANKATLISRGWTVNDSTA